MPDVIEMPYMPPVYAGQQGSGIKDQGTGFVYRLGGPSCLSGDVIGDYCFDHPLKEGELVLFGDLAIYSTCKNNTFNGMPLPAIYLKQGSNYTLLKSFNYADFKSRL
jgi:carboxynorspermidine decarboxylase